MNLGIRCLGLSVLLSTALLAQQRGEVPPPLVWDSLIWDSLKGNCPASLDWSSLKGKVVAISFGADDVFVADLAKWNEVREKFPTEPVVFLQIVTGSAFLLDQALSKIASPGCILWDPSMDNRENFRLSGIGTTVMVNREGSIAGYAAGFVNEMQVRAVVDYQLETGLSKVIPQPNTGSRPPIVESPPSYAVQISPAAPDEWRALITFPDSHTVRNFPLRVIISDLWEMPESRISFPKDLDAASYDVSVRLPSANRELVVRLARDAIQRQFGLRIEKEMRSRPVYLLRTTRHPSSQLQRATEDEREMTGGELGGMAGTAQSIADLARMFENEISAPVIDQTGLQGKYNYSAVSKLPRSEAGFDMARQLGLELTPAERPIEMLIVQKID